jgi:hypothetical protein
MPLFDAGIQRGTIAICSRGIIGVVTSDHQQEVTYDDGNKGIAWVGLALDDKTPWCSRNPEIIGTISLKYLRELESGTQEYL